MIRTVGLTELLSALPGPVIVLFALVTQLGDFWFTFTACALLYWVGPQLPRIGPAVTRDRAAMVVALLTLAVAVTVSLKALFAVPRPPGAGMADHAGLLPETVQALYESMATGDGYGFPSGHATSAVLVWGGFAWAIRLGSKRERTAVAATLIALIGLSRLVIGVHYLVDVLAGYAIAGALLWLALTVLRKPTRVFALAAVIAGAGLLAAGFTHDIGAALGMAVSGTLVWAVAGRAVPEPTRRGAAVTTALGVGTVGLFLGGALGLALESALVALAAAAGTGLLLALPLAGERLAKK